MGKLLCDGTTVTDILPPLITWCDPTTVVDMPPPGPTTTTTTTWDEIKGLEEQQRRNLVRLNAKGVLWKHLDDYTLPPVVFRLTHSRDIDTGGNCLFSVAQRAMESERKGGEREVARELRRRTVKRFEKGFGLAEKLERVKLLLNADHHFSLFKEKYGKRYGSDEEHNLQFGIFKANLRVCETPSVA